MGVPKRRVSHARQGDRRSHHAINVPELEDCPHCHQPKRMYHACPNCGWYRGREAIRIKQRAPSDTAGT